MQINRGLLTDDHINTATSYNNLAVNLSYQGKYAAADPFFRKAVEIRLRLLDADHDGVVSKEEFMAQANRNFARCDLDKDGRITTAECRQALRRSPATPANAER